MKKRREILLHPIRMRIFTEVTGGHTTAKALAQALPDVPQATLYRHIKTLAEAGFLQIVEEKPIRGTVERVYGLGTTGLSPEELHDMDADELRQAANMILGGFIADLDRFLDSRQGDPIDPIAEGFEFTKSQLHLTNQEFDQLKRELWSVLEKRLANKPSEGRRRRSFSYLFIPIE